MHGYQGKVLEINLTEGSCQSRPLSSSNIQNYVGGRGLATRLFVDEVDPQCDPLGPQNVLVIATSPLLGTKAPTACRGHMVFKSPLTGVIGSTNCGGSWAPVFKAAGYDALVIKGKPKHLSISKSNPAASPCSPPKIFGDWTFMQLQTDCPPQILQIRAHGSFVSVRREKTKCALQLS